MSSAPKRGRHEALAVATAQFYNATGTVPSQLRLPPDISYLISTHPSCTIVVSELPTGCTDHDLSGLFSRFGLVKRTKLVCNGRAALVEFGDISTPTRLVHMSKTNPFFVGNNNVRLEFSSETITPSNMSNTSADKSASMSEPTRILHLDVAAADYPITVDVVKAICTPYGKLQRVFIGKKNVDRSLEALVEFQTADEARKAKEQLDGADIYSGCCSLTVTYSQIPKVHVTKNDSESWDFTGPNASIQGPLNNSPNQRTLLSTSLAVSGTSSSPLMQTPLPMMQLSVPPHMPPIPSVHTNSPKMLPPPFLIPPQMGYYAVPPCMPPFPSPSIYGIPIAGNYGPAPYPVYSAPSVVPPARPVLRPISESQFTPTKVTILPTPTLTHPVSATGIGLGHATSNLNSAGTTHQVDLSIFESMEGVVLMACNLPVHLNCDHLFNLLCLYGNIARIKFLKTRPGCAMIQVGTAETADLIHRYYDSVTIFDRTIQFYHSKQPELTEHENLGQLDDGSPVMKNYMGDPNNRFRNVVVASRSRILEPSRTLHFFNTPLHISPEDISEIFANAGVRSPPRIVIFNTKVGQKTSLGLVEWDTLPEALEALALVNHHPIHVCGVSHPFHMKLAFSPKPISNDRTGQALIRYAAPNLPSTSDPVTTTQSCIMKQSSADDNDETSNQADSNNESLDSFHPTVTEPSLSVGSSNKLQQSSPSSDANTCGILIENSNTDYPSSPQKASVDSDLFTDCGSHSKIEDGESAHQRIRPRSTSSNESP